MNTRMEKNKMTNEKTPEIKIMLRGFAFGAVFYALLGPTSCNTYSQDIKPNYETTNVYVPDCTEKNKNLENKLQ